MKAVFLFMILCSGLTAFSQEQVIPQKEIANQSTISLSESIDEQKNYFSVRLLTLSGLNVSYARRLGDRFLLGVAASTANYQQGDKKSGSGSLDSGLYFAEAGHVQMEGQEINTTFYFREQGYKKWGALVRGAAGRVEGKIEGKYYRYDKDPAWIIIGDSKRLRETGPTQSDHFVTHYTRLGGYYQFVWTPEATIGGHILELGLSAAFMGERPRVYITRPDGTVKTIKADATIPIAEVAYAFTF